MDDLDGFVEAFETDRSREAVDLARYLPDRDHALYPKVLRELIRIDLEYSWQQGRPQSLDEYQVRFPDLFQDREAVAELAYEEYRLRCQGGEYPTRADYQRRYQIATDTWPVLERPVQRDATVAVPIPDARQEGAWETLDRCLKQLQQCDRDEEQVRLVLGAVQGSVHADAVYYWDAAFADNPVVLAGHSPLPARWCRDFVQNAIQKQAGDVGHLLFPVVQYFAVNEAQTVRSAALVRLSRSRPAWIVALSYNPARQLGVTDVKIMKLARRMLLTQRQHSETSTRLKETFFGLIRCLAPLIDARDPFSHGHSERVARLAVRLGRQMGLADRVLSDLYLAGLLHDVGNIGVREEVLCKPGKLTEAEMLHIQEHTVIGDRILATVGPLASLRAGVRSHHERHDGRGYPDRLAGKDIPLPARVLAVVDACDALMAARAYRPARAAGEVDAILSGGAGSQWDPEIIGHFMTCRHELYSLCMHGQAQPSTLVKPPPHP
jgi:HD-GYP domain-containing protein (c-di-GMP phosphodiesterase class II)